MLNDGKYNTKIKSSDSQRPDKSPATKHDGHTNQSCRWPGHMIRGAVTHTRKKKSTQTSAQSPPRPKCNLHTRNARPLRAADNDTQTLRHGICTLQPPCRHIPIGRRARQGWAEGSGHVRSRCCRETTNAGRKSRPTASAAIADAGCGRFRGGM